ncbi:MAG: four helix bundle protein [Candidatus Magasanikbacteria bacterium CG10_big_fil_rev_8_21_14_0_10_43_6]|uniref:Four helix bundle protein n=1 Tax=Candidatus Magasanikbacteria bacterium CG10_big_fil_rev_8_21_14_0_10_43_6 TaxID=1974650 RepID=A0A2M6W039_9BACT|nr:MAG: four helix bundle protein [Candidatus Magasanikbacteria bacterium CG10_big_fil_rev_8_21_14_0_10_43_6]
MEGNYLQLSNVDQYVKSYRLSNCVWSTVIAWDYFAKKTVGGQFVRSVDSISANIAEGFGRYHKKDKIKFYRYAFASVKESLDWNKKSYVRSFVSEQEYRFILEKLNELPKDINALISITNRKLKK